MNTQNKNNSIGEITNLKDSDVRVNYRYKNDVISSRFDEIEISANNIIYFWRNCNVVFSSSLNLDEEKTEKMFEEIAEKIDLEDINFKDSTEIKTHIIDLKNPDSLEKP